MSSPRQLGPRTDPARVALLPSLGRLAFIGLAAVLIPGIAAFVIAIACGVSTGPAGLIGLLAMFFGMGWFPTYLRKLGKRLPS